MWLRSLGQEDSLEEGIVTHSNILAWRILWTEEWATVHRARKSWTWLKRHNMHARTSGHGSLSLATLLGFHWNLLTHYEISYLYSTTKRFLISLHSQHRWFTEQVVSLAFRAISSEQLMTCCKIVSARQLTFKYLRKWRRKWQPTPVFLPGEFHGQRSLAG